MQLKSISLALIGSHIRFFTEYNLFTSLQSKNICVNVTRVKFINK